MMMMLINSISNFSIEYWVIIALAILIMILILFFILFIVFYKRKRFKFKINSIISDNLIKIKKNNYKFSSKNAFILFNEIKSLILDKRYKYFYKLKKRYKDGNLNNQIFELVKKYYLKNEKELTKKPKISFESKNHDKTLLINKEKQMKFVFDDQQMTVKIEEEK